MPPAAKWTQAQGASDVKITLGPGAPSQRPTAILVAAVPLSPPHRPIDLYRLAAPIYDLATAVWSGGAIWRSRASCLAGLRRGQTVLIPGPGTGRLAVEAAQRGASVTAVERSGAMAKALESRARRGLDPERFGSAAAADQPQVAGSLPGASAPGQLLLMRGSVEALAQGMTFDLVVAEHFLNVFQPDEMDAMRNRLIDRVSPGGRLAVADFTPIRAENPGPIRALQRFHHIVPLGGCSLLTRNAMHPVYDHGADLTPRKGLRLIHEQDFPSFGIGPRWFRTWIFEKIAIDE